MHLSFNLFKAVYAILDVVVGRREGGDKGNAWRRVRRRWSVSGSIV
jgi:hypothetical protein